MTTLPSVPTQPNPQSGEACYATKPTHTTLFLRTFLPWQIVRFIWINVKMLIIMRRSHKTH